MSTIQQIMISDVQTVTVDTPVLEAVQMLKESEMSSLPVVNDDGKLRGIVSEKDLLGLFYSPNDLPFKTVASYITEPAVCFQQDESIMDLCDCLSDSHFHSLPVTDSENRVVGQVSRANVLNYILHCSQAPLRQKAAAFYR